MTKQMSYRELIVFSVPSILSCVVEPIASSIDTALVGQMNTSWLAALGASNTLFNSFVWIFGFLVYVTTENMVSSGVKDQKKGHQESVVISLSVALGVGLLATALLVPFRFFAYQTTGVDEALFATMDQYALIRFLGLPLSLLLTTGLSLVRGLKLVNHSFAIVTIVTLVNVILSWLFLYHFNSGIRGVAIGTIVAQVIGILFCLIVILKNVEIKFSRLRSYFRFEAFASFSSKSLNMFGRSLSLTTCFFLATRFSASLSTEHLAAYQVLLQAWLISSFFIDGIAVTGNILTAELWPKRDGDALRILANRMFVIGAVIGFGFLSFYLGLNHFVIGLFTSDQQIFDLILKYWPYIAISQPLVAAAYIYDGILFGAAAFSFLRNLLIALAIFIFIPIAYLSQIQGEMSWIWIALILLATLRGVFGEVYIRRSIRKWRVESGI